MEEDIKILEEYLKECESKFFNGSEVFGTELYQPLKNLTKEFKKIKIENIEYRLGQTPDTTADYKTLKKELEKWEKI